MTQWVKALGSIPDNLSSVLRLYKVKGGNFFKLSYLHALAVWHTWVCARGGQGSREREREIEETEEMEKKGKKLSMALSPVHS